MAEQPPPDSPATRLLDFVIRAKAIQKERGGHAQFQVWSDILACDPMDLAAILRGITEVHELVNVCKADVVKLEVDQVLYLETLNEISGSFSRIGLVNQWADFCASWSDATVRSLRFVEANLRPVNRRIPVPEAELTTLLKDVTDLEQAMRESVVDPRLKQTVLDHLHAIRIAINAYAVGGIDYLEKVVAQSIGSVFLHKDLFKQNTKATGAYTAVLDRCRTVIAIAKAAVGLLTQAANARDDIERLLGSK